MRSSRVHRKKRVRKHVIRHATPQGNSLGLVERPVNPEINPALAVFLFRLRKRGEAARYEWAHTAAIVARHSVEFIGDKREGDLIRLENSEKKSDLPSATPKIDMICTPQTTALTRPFVRFAYPTISFACSTSARSPLVPPPRTLLS